MSRRVTRRYPGRALLVPDARAERAAAAIWYRHRRVEREFRPAMGHALDIFGYRYEHTHIRRAAVERSARVWDRHRGDSDHAIWRHQEQPDDQHHAEPHLDSVHAAVRQLRHAHRRWERAR